MPTASEKPLPNKPSALILLALKDLAKIERSKKYRVNMQHWHDPNGKCKVCFAGSVMAKTLGVIPESYARPSQFDYTTANKLFALNSFRIGELSNGLSEMNIRHPKTLPVYVEISNYDPKSSKSRAAFRQDMRGLVKLLRKHKL